MGVRNWFDPGRVRETVRRRALAALHDVADYTAARAVDYAPVDTGFLAGHIAVEELAGGLGFRVVALASYARPVHEGHTSRAGTWVPGRPFLAWALLDARAEWPAAVARVASGGPHMPEGHLGAVFTT